MPRQERVRRPHPAQRPPALPGQCGVCLAPSGEAEFCQDCLNAFAESEASQAASHQAYLEARERRVAEQQEELEEWRDQRRQERAAEHKAYMLRKEEERSALEAEENESWYSTLRFLATHNRRC